MEIQKIGGGFVIKHEKSVFAVNSSHKDAKAHIATEMSEKVNVANGISINGGGEYEISGIFIYGVDTTPKEAKEREFGYIFIGENIRTAVLAKTVNKETLDKFKTKAEEIDVIIVPTSSLSIQDFTSFVTALGGKIVIPTGGTSPALEKEIGAVEMGKGKSISIKKKDLSADRGVRVVNFE